MKPSRRSSIAMAALVGSLVAGAAVPALAAQTSGGYAPPDLFRAALGSDEAAPTSAVAAFAAARAATTAPTGAFAARQDRGSLARLIEEAMGRQAGFAAGDGIAADLREAAASYGPAMTNGFADTESIAGQLRAAAAGYAPEAAGEFADSGPGTSGATSAARRRWQAPATRFAQAEGVVINPAAAVASLLGGDDTAFAGRGRSASVSEQLRDAARGYGGGGRFAAEVGSGFDAAAVAELIGRVGGSGFAAGSGIADDLREAAAAYGPGEDGTFKSSGFGTGAASAGGRQRWQPPATRFAAVEAPAGDPAAAVATLIGGTARGAFSADAEAAPDEAIEAALGLIDN